MNGLALRISRGGGGKTKHSIGFSPIIVPTSSIGNAGNDNLQIQAFIRSASTDEQLTIMKSILESNKAAVDDGVIRFLVATFLQADAKHPIKSLISRHITKNKDLQQPFTEALVQQITLHIANTPSDYKQYIDVVSKVATCIENFNAGVAAVRALDITLVEYLRNCLECCVKILREDKTLSPTEKNEIFNLAHLCLRLLLHIVQKANTPNITKLILIFKHVRLHIQDLMFDDDVPMDTKSVCGILFLSMHVSESGAGSWIDVLNPRNTDKTLTNLLNCEAARLCLYSAITTVVTVAQLFTHTVDDGPAIVTLTKKILGIGERSSSESTFILSVSRTLLHISKLLDKTPDSSTGLTLVDTLLLFAWSHLEHYMDSVRHIAGQILGCVVEYCAKLDKQGDPTALNKLTAELSSLDRSRKSFYLSVSWLARSLGGRVVKFVALRDLFTALDSQPVHNTASTALETLLEKFSADCSTEELNQVWVQPILHHVRSQTCSCSVLGVMETLLCTAFTLHPPLVQHVIPYIKEEASKPIIQKRDLKCILMLLRVARKSGVTEKLSAAAPEDEWKGIISYDVLEQAAEDAVDETRILALSLVVESPKSTEVFSEGDFRFVMHYLKYNINQQAPNFRQLTLSVMKKFIKRLEDSYKVIWRQQQQQPNVVCNTVHYYLRFADELRRLCFDSLLPGANYSRRVVALQILVWCEHMHLEGYERSWEREYVEKLLAHLEDSYENNKVFALRVLDSCPTHLLKSKSYSMSLNIEDIFRQASSLKPTDCVSAAYKLEFLMKKLPEFIVQDEQCVCVDPVRYILAKALLQRARTELVVCERSVTEAAGRAPLYGHVRCLAHVLQQVHPEAISGDEAWTRLVGDVIDLCVAVSAAVACVVNNSSPEGHLPMDMSLQLTDHGNTGNVTLEDGRLVTAQMVLLCAWRSVKEVSLLLGSLCGSLSISGECSGPATLSVAQVKLIGQHFTSLLAETKHRGAFEQAYVGFTKLLARLWRCRSPCLHSLPASWLARLMQTIASGDHSGALCATRRSAGLPFMIQALVTTELQVHGNPKYFHSCMSTLLSVTRSAREESRTHALNILRALFRNAALHESVAPHVGDGLMQALRGFDGDSWAERNSSTLLFSALMVRVFGVQRDRDAELLCVRNRMTGRIFFLRYPQLYDFMLEKLPEVSQSEDTSVLRPSLYPVLLLLARLYPSSLEGTSSNLKLVAFIPHVLACAGSGVLKTRQLAAKAIVPLISPQQYIPHIQSMFKLIHNEHIARNYCHGILLQLVRLLDARPQDLEVEAQDLEACVEGALWVLRQATGTNPCYLIADEFVKLVNLLVWRFPALPQHTTTNILTYLHTLIFDSKPPTVSPGRDVCLSNAIYLHFILTTKNQIDTSELLFKGLQHSSYEVVLSVLNYLLILHNNVEVDGCKFKEHLTSISNKNTLEIVRKDDKYIKLLCKVLKNDYLECQQKSLKLLTLAGNTQKHIIQAKFNENVTKKMVIEKLFDCIQNEHEKLTHIYLESLLNLYTGRVKDSSLCMRVFLNVIRVVFECSSSDNDEETRNVVVGFIEKNINELLELDTSQLSEEETFELRATIWAIIITLLEDDEQVLRQRIADALAPLCGARPGRTPSVCGALLRAHIESGGDAIPLLTVIALLDFNSVVMVTDDVSDECRVFDQNERYNIFLEETVWTSACADKIIKHRPNDNLLSVIDNPVYKSTFEKLCKDNVEVFKKMVTGQPLLKTDALNPKIELFVNILKNNRSL